MTDWSPLWLSLRVATIATLLALVFGPWCARVLANRHFRGKDLCRIFWLFRRAA